MNNMEDKNEIMAHRIAEAVAASGGRVYYVGGLVRDRLIGRENKDIDIEVHGIYPEELNQLLSELGEVLEMGASFGILGLKGYEIDIAMPRSETATGSGHRDFDVIVDPFIGEEKAAVRRDFTMNALMQDVLTGEILDFFGGREDMKNGVIRHVNDVTFAEDPLRVLRAAQFAARFGYRIADSTAELSVGMDLTALASERIMGELTKALLKSERPSVFFREMRRMRQLSLWFAEVETLEAVPQNLKYHPEGNVWNHTMLVLDEAAKLRDRASWPLGFMMAALVHDFGKAEVTETDESGQIHAYGHETAGLQIIRNFLLRICRENRMQDYVLNMAQLHMSPNMLVSQHAGIKAYMRMFDRSCEPRDLLLLAKADHLGRKAAAGEDLILEYEETERILSEKLAVYEERMARPYVQGRDLVAAGAKPGPAFTEALRYAHKMRLAGVPKDLALPQTLAYLKGLD